MKNRSKKVIVTGGSGKLGRACVKDLLAHGYDVFNVDTVLPRNEACPFILADLADFGETLDAFSSVDTAGKAVLNSLRQLSTWLPSRRRDDSPIR
jgi:nucleoside-diphosphate-sugar epimerase